MTYASRATLHYQRTPAEAWCGLPLGPQDQFLDWSCYLALPYGVRCDRCCEAFLAAECHAPRRYKESHRDYINRLAGLLAGRPRTARTDTPPPGPTAPAAGDTPDISAEE